MSEIGFETQTQLQPTIFDYSVALRFSDLDSYGHINAKHYLDYVMQSRWNYAREVLKITEKDFIEKKLGFFITQFSIQYQKPITAQHTHINVKSWCSNLAGAKISLLFEIMDSQNKTKFAQGNFDLFAINLETNKPTDLPDWAKQLLFIDNKN